MIFKEVSPLESSLEFMSVELECVKPLNEKETSRFARLIREWIARYSGSEPFKEGVVSLIDGNFYVRDNTFVVFVDGRRCGTFSLTALVSSTLEMLSCEKTISAVSRLEFCGLSISEISSSESNGWVAHSI